MSPSRSNGACAERSWSSRATLVGFAFTASPKLPAAQIRDLAALRWLHSGESVILFGPVAGVIIT
ncbi:hypothetical protein ABT276_31965 [Streptomyces xantholiticus]|uniref:Uncharacterized protein n=1 Tax=Streptomyces xantholiticus TaxID=68285 RepID=A0ABV1V476_9ACTN